jgi:hypothetical protein
MGILSKLYDTDVTSMRLTYKDEEGDDIAVTTDDELLEAFRLAQESQPPILRLLIVPSNLSISQHSQNLLNSVLSNSVPPSPSIQSPSRPIEVSPPEPKKPEVTPEEKSPIQPAKLFPKPEKSVFSSEKKEPSDSLPVVYISGKAYVPKGQVGASKPYTGPTKVPSSSAFKQPEKPVKPSIVNLTNQLAESTTTLVLESSDSTFLSSTILSDTISEQSQKLYDKTVDSNIEVAQAISEQTNYFCKKSEIGELDDNIRQSLTNACYETGQNSVKLSDQIAAMSIENSNQISEDLKPVSNQTRLLQDAATLGLEEQLSKGVDAVVQNILSATKPTLYE